MAKTLDEEMTDQDLAEAMGWYRMRRARPLSGYCLHHPNLGRTLPDGAWERAVKLIYDAQCG